MHLAAHILHDRFNVSSSGAMGEVLSQDDELLAPSGAADVEVCGSRLAGSWTAIALSIDVSWASKRLLLLWVGVARVVVVVGVGLARAVGAVVGGWWTSSSAWSWCRVGAWERSGALGGVRRGNNECRGTSEAYSHHTGAAGDAGVQTLLTWTAWSARAVGAQNGLRTSLLRLSAAICEGS